VKYVGVDWAYRQAQWCALTGGGEVAGEGRIAADRDGLARLVLELGDEVKACLEMMSGALWVRDQLVACGWQVEVADARKVKTVAPLAAKTDKVDARLLAELSRRELVPALWLPSLDERALRERLRRRMHLVRSSLRILSGAIPSRRCPWTALASRWRCTIQPAAATTCSSGTSPGTT
jgi:transposase